jgi:hypothetical protein
MNGITLEGVPVAHVTSPVHTVSLEDAAELNGQRGAAPAEAESSVHSRELEALRFLRAA